MPSDAHDADDAPVISLPRFRELRGRVSRAAALRLATYPAWPGNELADWVMDMWISTTPGASDAEICEKAEITAEELVFILDRQWDWWENPEIELDADGRPRLLIVGEDGELREPRRGQRPDAAH